MKTTVVIVLVFVFGNIGAQTYEVGIFLGGANNIGDVGRTNFVSPSGIAYGGLFKWNISKRYAWRTSIAYGNFTANDTKSGMAYRVKRGYVVNNSVLEVSGGLELNFVEYNLHKLGLAFTPYLYTGVTYFRYDFNYFDVAGKLQDSGRRDGAFAVPMVVGAKFRINQFFVLGAEVGVRYTFTDNLDASNPGVERVSARFGNVNSDDWYVFSGLTLTYTFGRKPCKGHF